MIGSCTVGLRTWNRAVRLGNAGLGMFSRFTSFLAYFHISVIRTACYLLLRVMQETDIERRLSPYSPRLGPYMTLRPRVHCVGIT